MVFERHVLLRADFLESRLTAVGAQANAEFFQDLSS
jgi:hypothetical protein